jgi:molybdopterin/thiamine biosynthesis adenylyltransferase
MQINSSNEKFSRQRGLLKQHVLQNLNVVFSESSHIPESFVRTMQKMSQQLGVTHFPGITNEPHFKVQWIDEPGLIEFDTDTIPIHFGQKGVFLNGKHGGDEIEGIYEQSVATIASCLVWSEIIRRSKAYQPVEIPKITVSVNVRVNENSLYRNVNDLTFDLGGHHFSKNIRDINDGTSHRRVSLRLDQNDPITQHFLNTLEVNFRDEHIESKFPELEFQLLPIHDRLEGHISIVGAGGLGTWCLYNLVEGLQKSINPMVNFLIFDKDLEVEKHNLNRQVIFTEDDIGKAKIHATKEWLKHRLPTSEIDIAYELTDMMTKRSFVETSDGIDLDDLFVDHEDHSFDGIEDELGIADIISIFDRTNLIIGCLDAMRPRVLANLIATERGIPYINAGVSNFYSQFQLFTSTNLVELYGKDIATDVRVSSCQEDGDVPLSSMVLTNAFAGAFQAISIIQMLNGQKENVLTSCLWNAYNNDIHVNFSDVQDTTNTSTQSMKNALWGRGDLE